MNKSYDIIVIGGGHNGLTTATILAKKGMKVLLLEKNKFLGGIASGHEFIPGYRTTGLVHDTSGVRTSVLKQLGLEQFGLKIKNARPDAAILAKDGRGIFLPSDRNKAIEEITKISKDDGEAYRDYRIFIDEIGKFLFPLLNEIPPDLIQFGTKELFALGKKGLALKKLGKKTMTELLKVGPMSVADFLNERFETEFLKAGLLGPSIYASYTGPWSSYTTLNLLMWEVCAREHIVGGPQALVNALEKAAISAGVVIKLQSEVSSINVDKHGMVTGITLKDGAVENSPIVASSCTPQHTFLDLLAPNVIDYPLERSIQNYRSRGTTAKVNIALSNKVKFKFKSDDTIEYARTGNSIDEMEKAFDSVKYRKFSDHPILDIHVPSVSDPTVAPDGHSVLSILVHFAPYHFDAGWNKEQKDRLKDNVEDMLLDYIENSRDEIVGCEVLSPVDFEDQFNLTNGHIFHGEHAVDQLITRPIPYCARYDTPIKGLYLSGSGAHPGGGITCAPGFLAAERIIKHKD